MLGPIKPFNAIGRDEDRAVAQAIDGALSGYLAGKERGGRHVCALEDAWAETFGVKHAIAVNSATSGLLASAFAVGLGPGDTFICPAMTMSATAAAPMFTGATPEFRDVEDETFGLEPAPISGDIRAVFSTNLFGHPAPLGHQLQHHSTARLYHIEDNSQSPFAMAHGRYAGTMGTIGVWSLNVHKHMQCGEGGMVTTDVDYLAERLRAFINHGEHVTDRIGLNLRMPELCAAVALSQLRRGREIVSQRVEQAQAILAAIGKIPGILAPIIREGCTHVFYTIPFLVEMRVGNANCDFNPIMELRRRRSGICYLLREHGVPMVEGYVPPLYRMPAFKPYARRCPVAERLHDETLFYFENCAWDLTRGQIRQLGDAFKLVAETINA